MTHRQAATTPTRAALAAAALLWLAAVAPAPAADARTGRATGTIRVGGEDLVVELAVTADGARDGLSHRDRVAPGTDGMLFLAQGMPGFGMEGMRFCLDFVWIDGDEVIGTTENACPPPPGSSEAAQSTFFPPGPITAAIEVPAGSATAAGIGTGSAVSRLDVSPRTVATMVKKAARNRRFGADEVAAITGTLLVAGADPTAVSARMAEATADGRASRTEVKRIVKRIRGLLAGADNGAAAGPSRTSDR